MRSLQNPRGLIKEGQTPTITQSSSALLGFEKLAQPFGSIMDVSDGVVAVDPGWDALVVGAMITIPCNQSTL